MLYLMTDYQQNFYGSRQPYLTAGKLYAVVSKDPTYSDLFTIYDDTGYPITVPIGRPSAHLNDRGVFKLYELVEKSA